MATATQRTTLVGIFDSVEGARRAVEELHRAGFGDHQITMVHHHTPEGDVEVTDLDAAKAAQVSGETKEAPASALGAVTGALVGGAVAAASMAIPGLGAVTLLGSLIGTGVLAGVATGVVGGAVGGGIVGALVGLDFPEHEARLYEQELKAGRALVGVRAGDRSNEAWDIIRLNGGRELEQEVVDVLPVVEEAPADVPPAKEPPLNPGL
jgi:hypothetical protein